MVNKGILIMFNLLTIYVKHVIIYVYTFGKIFMNYNQIKNLEKILRDNFDPNIELEANNISDKFPPNTLLLTINTISYNKYKNDIEKRIKEYFGSNNTLINKVTIYTGISQDINNYMTMESITLLINY